MSTANPDKYDAFISYRRESGAAEARLIRAELRDRKVRAFLDVDDLKAGHFDEALLTRIANAPNFIVILSPHSLDRCGDERDWLRQEIAQAVKTGRNIIPILLRGFEFPDTGSLPDELKALPLHNGLEYSHKYFNAMIADILTYLRTEDSLEQKQKDASRRTAQQAIAPAADRVETETTVRGLTFKELVDSPISLVGHKVGRYVIKEIIGSGGSGFVYRAQHPALGQDLCVKLFYPFTPEGQDAASIVARGVRGLAAMNHPHIIKVFDFEMFSLEDASSFYLVMELVRGKRLDEWSSSIAESGSTVATGLQMAVDITRALAAAHHCRYIDELGFERTGILHGDIKPGNVIVRADNSPVVLDFMMLDVQRLLDPRVVPPSLLRGRQDQPITAAYGTPGFMAPEQDRDGIVTVKTDIYGLGVTLAYLFFPGANNPMSKVLVSDDDDQLNGLRSIIKAMVAEDPDARPRDMEEVAQRLTACVETLASDAPAAARNTNPLLESETGEARLLQSKAVAEQPLLDTTSTISAVDADTAQTESAKLRAGDPISNKRVVAQTDRSIQGTPALWRRVKPRVALIVFSVLVILGFAFYAYYGLSRLRSGDLVTNSNQAQSNNTEPSPTASAQSQAKPGEQAAQSKKSEAESSLERTVAAVERQVKEKIEPASSVTGTTWAWSDGDQVAFQPNGITGLRSRQDSQFHSSGHWEQTGNYVKFDLNNYNFLEVVISLDGNEMKGTMRGRSGSGNSVRLTKVR